MKNKKVTLGDENPTKTLPEPEPEPEPEPGGEDDIFEAELLPAYAKTYILPRKMRKWSVSSESAETEEEAGPGWERSRKGGFARKQSAVTPEFQMSMLRASLEESKIVSTSELNEEKPAPRSKVSLARSQSLVPCVAAGGMREYTDFVKEGNFSPMTVLDPDLGMDTEIFAKVRSSSVGSTRATSGRMSSLLHHHQQYQHQQPPAPSINLDEAFTAVTQALQRVEKDNKVSSDRGWAGWAESLVLQERKEAELSSSSTTPSSSSTLAPPEVKRRGRRGKACLEDSLTPAITPDSANSERSSGYQSQGNNISTTLQVTSL